MGISDTFPLKLGLTRTHHNLSHAGDKDATGVSQSMTVYLSEQLAHFFRRMEEYRDTEGSVFDNTIVLFGSARVPLTGPATMPTLVAAGNSMGIRHGQYWRQGEKPEWRIFPQHPAHDGN